MNEQEILNNETTLRDYLRVLFRHKAVMLVTVLTVCFTVFVGLKLKTKVYEAQVKMLISAEKQVEAPYYKEFYGSRNVQQTLTQSEIVKSMPVLSRVVRALHLDKRPLDDEKNYSSKLKAKIIEYRTAALKRKLARLTPEERRFLLFRMAVENLKKNIKVEPIRDTNMFTISVRDYNPVGAAVIANVVSRAYVIFDLEQQLAELRLKYGEKHPTIKLINENISRLKKTLSGEPLDDIEAIGPASVKIIEQASVPMKPVGTPKIITFIIAVIMSIFLAIMLAFIFEYADQTFKLPQEIEKTLNLPFLGSIPKRRLGDRLLLHNMNRRSPYVNFYRIISDQLYILLKDKKIKSILITSTEAKEGTSAIVANLGIYLSQKAGHKVLLIDANLRYPSLHKLFKLKTMSSPKKVEGQRKRKMSKTMHLSSENSLGLAGILEGNATLKDVVKHVDKKLDVIEAGTTDLNPVILLDSSNMDKMLKQAYEEYEIILIDCPNLRGNKDAVIVSSHVDATVIVINEGKVRRQVIQNAIRPLKDKDKRILGVILNNRTFPIPRLIYDHI